MTKQEFAAVVQAWADGASIQARSYDEDGRVWEWVDTDAPCWFAWTEFRVKPAGQEVEL